MLITIKSNRQENKCDVNLESICFNIVVILGISTLVPSRKKHVESKHCSRLSKNIEVLTNCLQGNLYNFPYLLIAFKF